jgi:acetyl esterase/lipase
VYGTEDKDQFCRFHYIKSTLASSRKLPVVIIFHGGFWKNKWTIDNAAHTSLAPSLVSTNNYLAVEAEYRRRDSPGGGYHGSQDDVAACIAFVTGELAVLYPNIDENRLVLLGHSAGGQLCLWAADHFSKQAMASIEMDDMKKLVAPRLVVAISPITDMIAAYDRHLSDEGDVKRLLFVSSQPELLCLHCFM